MITERFRGFNNLVNMKMAFWFLAITVILSCDRTRAGNGGTLIAKSDDITIDYKGFYAPVNSHNCNQLIFTIQNNTNDTLYISSDHIDAQVLKNGQILKEKPLSGASSLFPPDFLTEMAFTTDVPNSEPSLTRKEKEQRMQSLDLLKARFARKLYDRNPNVKKHFTEDTFYYAVRSVCLILLPKERISYDRLFISASLDNTCTVNPKYEKDKVFTTLKDETGSEIKVIVY